MTLVTRPPMTDDDGSFTAGTVINKAFIDALLDEVDDQVHSAAAPTVKPKDVLAEVVAARGSAVDLEARLDSAEADVASIGTPGQMQASIGKTNLLLDETFLVWAGGDAVAPSSWTFAGAGATIARAGTGLADTNTKIGDFCAKMTRASADTTLSQIVLSSGYFPLAYSVFRGHQIGFGAWVRSTAIGGARLYVNDGVDTVYSTANVLANTWEWLSLTHVMDSAADGLIVGVINDVNASSCYFSGGNLVVGDTGGAPTEWTPSPVVYQDVHFSVIGNIAVVAPKFVWAPHRPGIVKDMYAICGTAPTGADIKIDVNSWDGAAYTTMTTTKLTVAAAAVTGQQAPDGTYARRCLRGNFTSGTTFAGSRVSIDVDQVGSGVAGADVTICLRILFPARYLETILGYDQVGA